MTVLLSILVAISILLGLMSPAWSAKAAHYVVDGAALGDRIEFSSPTYQSYTCKPSEDLAAFTRCQRTQQKKNSYGNAVVANTIMTAQDGSAVYIMINVAPVPIRKTQVEDEIKELSREFDET